MTRLTSLYPMLLTLICGVAFLISGIGLLNSIVYDFIQNEFWLFLFISILSIVGLVLIARSPVLYYDKDRLVFIKNLKKETFSIDDIDKLYAEGLVYTEKSFGFSTWSGHYVQAQILFKPGLNRKGISFVVEVPALGKFQQMLESR